MVSGRRVRVEGRDWTQCGVHTTARDIPLVFSRSCSRCGGGHRGGEVWVPRLVCQLGISRETPNRILYSRHPHHKNHICFYLHRTPVYTPNPGSLTGVRGVPDPISPSVITLLLGQPRKVCHPSSFSGTHLPPSTGLTATGRVWGPGTNRSGCL